MATISERLRKRVPKYGAMSDTDDDILEAADTIDALVKALEPFAEASVKFDMASLHFGLLAPDDGKPRTRFTHGHLRAALAAIAMAKGQTP